MATGWKRSKSETWFYARSDADAIWQAKHGTRGPRRSKPTGGKRGRRAVGDPAADAAFVAGWRASSEKLTAYAVRVGVSVEKAEATYRRHRSSLANAKRRSASNRAASGRQAKPI